MRNRQALRVANEALLLLAMEAERAKDWPASAAEALGGLERIRAARETLLGLESE